MGDAPEVVQEVGVNDVRMAAKQRLFHLDHRLLGAADRAVGILLRWKVGLEDRLPHQHRKGGRVGLCNVFFEDCSAFTRVTACTLAGLPKVIRYIEGFSYFVTSITAPIASGWSKIAGWDSHPLENAAFARRTPYPDIRPIQLAAVQQYLTGPPASSERVALVKAFRQEPLRRKDVW